MRWRHSVRRTFALSLVVSLAAPAAALAQRGRGVPPSADEANASDARALFEQGLAAADGERWGDAVLFFQRSLALVERPSTQINLGNALVRAGRAVEASTLLRAYLASAGSRNDPTREAQARAMLAEAERSVVTLVVRVSGPAGAAGQGVEVRVDGRAVNGVAAGRPGETEVRVDPGAHTITARQAGDGAEGQQTVNSLPGARAVVELRLRVPASATPRLAVLTFAGAPASAEVLADGEPRGSASGRVELAPGEHRIEIRAAGYASTTQRVTLASGEERRLLVTLAPARPGEGPRASRGVLASPAFWGVVGGVLVAGGVTTAAIVATQASAPPSAAQGNWGGPTIQGIVLGP